MPSNISNRPIPIKITPSMAVVKNKNQPIIKAKVPTTLLRKPSNIKIIKTIQKTIFPTVYIISLMLFI